MAARICAASIRLPIRWHFLHVTYIACGCWHWLSYYNCWVVELGSSFLPGKDVCMYTFWQWELLFYCLLSTARNNLCVWDKWSIFVVVSPLLQMMKDQEIAVSETCESCIHRRCQGTHQSRIHTEGKNRNSCSYLRLSYQMAFISSEALLRDVIWLDILQGQQTSCSTWTTKSCIIAIASPFRAMETWLVTDCSSACGCITVWCIRLATQMIVSFEEYQRSE